MVIGALANDLVWLVVRLIGDSHARLNCELVKSLFSMLRLSIARVSGYSRNYVAP